MLPILQEENVSCLFFVTGFSLGKTPVMLWYEQLYLLLQKAPRGPNPKAWTPSSAAELRNSEIVGRCGGHS